ncbi:MAG: lytic transglycosylase domain-containing protein [Acidobacteria bacterium]|nr:lytic transglycosylase domain-containing protein [Acidobacteriota bacterium]
MGKRIVAGMLAMVVVWAQDVVTKGKEPPPPTRVLHSLEAQRQSIDKQWEAARKQHPGFFDRLPPASSPLPPDCDSVKPGEIKSIIDRESKKRSLDSKLVQAVIEAESAYVPCAVSPAGALGLMQLMPATAEELNVADPFDAAQNVAAGTEYLKMMLDRYGGDLGKALAAYNAGPAKVDAAKGIPSIPETQAYVKKILTKLEPPSKIE